MSLFRGLVLGFSLALANVSSYAIDCDDVVYGNEDYHENLEFLLREARIVRGDSYFTRYDEELVSSICKDNIETIKGFVDDAYIEGWQVDAVLDNLITNEDYSESYNHLNKAKDIAKNNGLSQKDFQYSDRTWGNKKDLVCGNDKTCIYQWNMRRADYLKAYNYRWDEEVTLSDLDASETYLNEAVESLKSKGLMTNTLEQSIKKWQKNRDKTCGRDIDCRYGENFSEADKLRKLAGLPLGG